MVGCFPLAKVYCWFLIKELYSLQLTVIICKFQVCVVGIIYMHKLAQMHTQ
jgi:hypothetical protein